MTTNKEAQKKYYETRKAIAAELKKLEKSLFSHNQEQSPSNIHWGHVGDMQYILSQLKELNENED